MILLALLLAGTATADARLLDDVEQLAAQVAAVRDERLPRPPVAVRAGADHRRVAAEVAARARLPGERLAARGRAWSDVGLGGPRGAERLLVSLAADLDGARADWGSGRLLVDPGRLTAADFKGARGEGPSELLETTGVRPDEPLLAHMVVHLLQRARERPAEPETTDALLADAAWREGEANVVAVRYLFRGMGIADDVMEIGLDPGSVLDGGLVPPDADGAGGAIERLLDFVYRDGFEQASEVQRGGGWDALEHAARRRRSTRDVLHGDRSPLGPVSPLPAEWTPPEGYREADRDTLGEQAVIALVSVGSGKDNLGLLAGDGWVGDGLYRFEQPGDPDRGITLWVTRWTDEQAAADFEYGLLRSLAGRFPGAGVERAERGDVLVRAGGRTYRIERRARSVRTTVGPA